MLVGLQENVTCKNPLLQSHGRPQRTVGLPVLSMEIKSTKPRPRDGRLKCVYWTVFIITHYYLLFLRIVFYTLPQNPLALQVFIILFYYRTLGFYCPILSSHRCCFNKCLFIHSFIQ